jgi:ubiquitin C-terminal hydrolase
MRKIKINSYLKFPEMLNMQKYTADYLAGDQGQPEGNFTYALRGTVIHSGTSEGGHYYSFVKPNDKWYCFNDEFLDEISPKKI